jgi:hypothetical protein
MQDFIVKFLLLLWIQINLFIISQQDPYMGSITTNTKRAQYMIVHSFTVHLDTDCCRLKLCNDGIVLAKETYKTCS